jgi:hypothetical protein
MKVLQALILVLVSVWMPSLSLAGPVKAQAAQEKTKSASAINEVSLDRLNSTPDLMQSLPAASLPDGGLAYCGPVAVSNSLVWLSHKGYPKLGMLGGSDTPARQGRLARKLGDFMGCGTGTSPTCLLGGVSAFVLMNGYQFESLKYQGWESHPDMFSTGVKMPDPAFIKQGLQGPSGVWLMIGFYTYSKTRDEYAPFAQHWVTVVGYGQDRQGKKDPNILIIHDPAPRSGAAMSHDFVKLERLSHGTFAGTSGRNDLKASGWYRLGGDLKIKKGADCAILDGAVVLKMKPPNSQ